MLPALPFTHVIITFNKTRHFITAAENAALSVLGNGVLAHLNGNSINTSSIAEVLTLEDFYRAFPDERPEEKNERIIPDHEAVPLDQQTARSERALRGLLSGMAHYIEHHGGNPYFMSELEKHKGTYKKRYGKDFVYTDEDKDRVIDAFMEKDNHGLPKIPCEKCLDPYLGRKKSNRALSTVAQFA